MSGDLNHSPSDIIKHLLVNESVGTLVSAAGTWPIFDSYERDDPDDAITMYDTAGNIDGRNMVNGETQHHYGIQARVRGKDKTTGWLKAQSIISFFDDVERNMVVISSSTYLVQAVHVTSGVIPLGADASSSRRRLFTINALVTLRMTS